MKCEDSRVVLLPSFAVALVVLYLVFATKAHAEVVSFNFSGVITTKNDTNDFFRGGFEPGSGFTGNMTVDTSSAGPDLYPNDPKLALYAFPSQTPVGHFILTVMAGEHVDTGYSGGINVYDNPRGSLGGEHLSYGPLIKTYDGIALPPTFTQMHYSIGFSKTTPPFNAVTGDALPTGIPVLSAFDIARISISAVDSSRGITFFVQGQVAAITPVPEPSMGILLMAGIPSLWALRRCSVVQR